MSMEVFIKGRVLVIRWRTAHRNPKKRWVGMQIYLHQPRACMRRPAEELARMAERYPMARGEG